ncbi:glycine/betaine/sarcosine/D-proline reductase family selenoprotein B [Enterococcus hermanniensis]|uniref:Glycine/betaine/sarcosine/D-proline reductase family selenoprotein B n=3 Tax=Enterococcus hermanniensis TaxID=249189 RepID=A0A1L8TQS5_9ENTE|nr:glycine/betaine/sarcosine/D-proline reductase family selenoprotein B [Enterococcus hermanniensis]
MTKYRVVHYINQFYAGIGGEEKADIRPFSKEKVVGPGLAFMNSFGEEAEIVGTVVCGDSFFNENLDSAKADVLERIKQFNPDIVIAGPAFNAGRYGIACGEVAQAVMSELKITAVTGMYEENPGVEMYKKGAYIAPTRNSAAGMRKAVPILARLALKLLNGESVSPEKDSYFIRYRKNFQAKSRGSERAVDMLLHKLKDEEFMTEYPMPEFDNVAPANAINDLSKVKITLVTSGGIVPKGNPDRIESSSASKYGMYPIESLDKFAETDYETAHGGYDPVYINQDPNRVLPLDIVREMERTGVIGSLHNFFYTTVGNGTAVANAKKYAAEIAQKLLADGVDAVILTST